ncbi:hypothetical protein I5T99_12550 [Stenotrophomonas maltophilia]|nr:hypothetical protein [Stenotrophomonas maltophilia]
MNTTSKQETITKDGTVFRGPEPLRARMEAAICALSANGFVTTDAPEIGTYVDVDPMPRWVFRADSPLEADRIMAWIDDQS